MKLTFSNDAQIDGDRDYVSSNWATCSNGCPKDKRKFNFSMSWMLLVQNLHFSQWIVEEVFEQVGETRSHTVYLVIICIYVCKMGLSSCLWPSPVLQRKMLRVLPRKTRQRPQWEALHGRGLDHGHIQERRRHRRGQRGSNSMWVNSLLMSFQKIQIKSSINTFDKN